MSLEFTVWISLRITLWINIGLVSQGFHPVGPFGPGGLPQQGGPLASIRTPESGRVLPLHSRSGVLVVGPS